MKKKVLYVIVLLPIFMGTQSLVVDAAAPSTTIKPEKLYEETFESYAVGATGTDIYNDKKLMWFDSGANASVVDVYGDKQLEYQIISAGEYATLGGIGTGEIKNLSKLVGGTTYHFSMYIDTLQATAGSTLWVEYQSDIWVGAKIIDGVASPCSVEGISNLKYDNNILEFDFKGYNHGDDMNKGWVKLTAQNMSIGDEIYLDDFSITHEIKNNILDFEDETIGDVAPKDSASAVSMVYNKSFNSVVVGGDESNKYLSLTNPASSSSSYVYPIVYFNYLSFLKDQTKYRVSIDFIEQNFTEVYVSAYESSTGNLTYSSTGFLYASKPENTYVTNGSFDGKTLEFDFLTDKTLSKNFWNQLKVTFKHKAELSVKIDNIKFTEIELENTYAGKSIDVAEVPSLYVGTEFDPNELVVNYTRNNDITRVLNEDEYTVDTSAVNKNEPGTYPVTITVVDEFKNVLTKEVSVTYVADNVTGLTIKTAPTKLVYNYNDPIDLTGLAVSQTYESGKVVDADVSKLEVSGYNPNQVGKQTVTLTGENGKTVTFEVEVLDQITGASLVLPTDYKIAYNYGEDLSLEGVTMKIQMISGNV